MSLFFYCSKCDAIVEDGDIVGCWENEWCEECARQWIEGQVAHYWPLYQAEKRAGILEPSEYIAHELRCAGRGHLLKER